MYGKHRCILRSNGKVAIAGKRTPESKGGSYQPMGRWFWSVSAGYGAEIRKPHQWYQAAVSYNEMEFFSAPSKAALREMILSYYDKEAACEERSRRWIKELED
jgi:hypothetical protein